MCGKAKPEDFPSECEGQTCSFDIPLMHALSYGYLVIEIDKSCSACGTHQSHVFHIPNSCNPNKQSIDQNEMICWL